MCMILLIWLCFRLDFMDLLSFDTFNRVEISIWSAFLIAIYYSIVVAFLRVEQVIHQRWRYILLEMQVLILAMFFPFDKMHDLLDFFVQYDRREAAVHAISALPPTKSAIFHRGIHPLPTGFESLSRGGGKVLVTDSCGPTNPLNPKSLHVRFYTSLLPKARFTGLEYSADGHLPRDSQALNVLPLNSKWYWIADLQ